LFLFGYRRQGADRSTNQFEKQGIFTRFGAQYFSEEISSSPVFHPSQNPGHSTNLPGDEFLKAGTRMLSISLKKREVEGRRAYIPHLGLADL